VTFDSSGEREALWQRLYRLLALLRVTSMRAGSGHHAFRSGRGKP
jgi:hypothetical protein